MNFAAEDEDSFDGHSQSKSPIDEYRIDNSKLNKKEARANSKNESQLYQLQDLKSKWFNVQNARSLTQIKNNYLADNQLD